MTDKTKEKLPTKFDIDTFFNEDAKEIFSAREKGMAIHKTKNIDAAGDEIELPVKDIIKKRLPQKYYVGQGHVVDAELNTSGQFDIIVADNNGSPILFSSANDTDYLTYESVYLVGEIKSTYYKNKNYVKDFIEKIKLINEKLHREATPPDQLSQDLRFSTDGMITITSSDRRPYKNPLFKFMFFVNSGDLDIAELGKLLSAYDQKHLPNFICFLDKGVVLKAEAKLEFEQPETTSTESKVEGNHTEVTMNILQNMKWKLGNVDLYPEFISADNLKNYKWVLYEFENEKTSASILAYVIYALNTHIKDCMVLKPNLIKYHEKLFKIKQATILGGQ